MKHGVLDGELCWITENLKQRFVTQRFQEVHGMPWGAILGSQGRGQGRSNRYWMEHMLLLESMSGVLWGSWVKAKLVNSNLTSCVWVASRVFYLRGAQEEGPWRQGRLFITRAFGEVISRTYICLWLCVLLSRACTCISERGSITLTSLQATLTQQNGCQSSSTVKYIS